MGYIFCYFKFKNSNKEKYIGAGRGKRGRDIGRQSLLDLYIFMG